MKSLLLFALAGATFASEIALDAPEQFIKEQKDAKYSQLVSSEDLRETLNKPAGAFSLSASPDPLYFYAPYGYATGYASPLPGASYQSVQGQIARQTFTKRDAPPEHAFPPLDTYGYHGSEYDGYGYLSSPSISAGGYAGYRPGGYAGYRPGAYAPPYNPYYGKRSAEPDAEADPLHYYAPYSYPYFYRPYAATGYSGPLPGASYQSVHRLHKREAQNFGTTYQHSGAPAAITLTPGNKPGLVPGSAAAAAWWTAQLQHQEQIAHHQKREAPAAVPLTPGNIPGLVPGSAAMLNAFIRDK